MKKLISGNKFSIGVGLLLLIISISNGCTKDTTSTTTTSNSSKGSGPGANEVWIQNMAFNPGNITVPVGTKVTWTNKDAVTHNVTSTTNAFSSGSLVNGATYSYTFSIAGTFPYSCTIHPSMTGTVTVTGAPATPGY